MVVIANLPEISGYDYLHQRSLVAQLLEPHGTPIVLDANYVGSVFLKGYIGLALWGWVYYSRQRMFTQGAAPYPTTLQG